MMYWYDAVVFLFALIIRIVLAFYDAYKVLGSRIEIVNPLTSKKRVVECVALFDYGIPPYTSDVCHQPPLMILFLKYCNRYKLFYAFGDIVTALQLYLSAKVFAKCLLKKQNERKNIFAKDIEILLLDTSRQQSIPSMVAAVYLFNPYTIISCAAESTVTLSNLVNAAILLTTLKGWFGMATLLVSVSSYLSLYPVMFIIPIILYSYNKTPSIARSVIYPMLVLGITTAGLLISSYHVFESWDFLHAVYGFILEAPDLTPNMGLFWYFFLEMFDHFRLFFLWVYQMNVFIYVIPLAIVFRKSPIFILYVLLSVMSVSKSYSNFGDMSLPLAMLPLWSHIYRYMRNVLVVIGVFLVTTILAPCMWYLWIYAGSGNANFFYAVTLVYNAAQVFLLSDVLYAYLRYDFHLVNGLAPKTKDGKEGTVIMQ